MAPFNTSHDPGHIPKCILAQCQCFVCCREIKFCRFKRVPTRTVASIMSNVFQVFCKYMKCKSSRKKHEFDFTKEYFPFCKMCKRTLLMLYRLDKEMQRSLKRIQKVRLKLLSNILVSSRKSLANNFISTKSIDDIASYTSYKRLFGDNMTSYERKIQHYRNLVDDEFSPSVKLRPLENIPKAFTKSCEGIGDCPSDVNKKPTEFSIPIGFIEEHSREENNNTIPTDILASLDKCLVCLGYANNYDYPSKSSAVARILSILFHVLCKYMKWKIRRKYQFNFKFEAFPFCQICRSRLAKIYKLDKSLNSTSQDIQNIMNGISSSVLKTEKTRSFQQELKLFTCNSPSLICHNAKKSHYFRTKILKGIHKLKGRKTYAFRSVMNDESDVVSDDDLDDQSTESDSSSSDNDSVIFVAIKPCQR